MARYEGRHRFDKLPVEVPGYIGVRYHRRNKVFQAYYIYQGIEVDLGHYRDAIEAAKAYDHAALHVMGRHTQTNFPRTGDQH